MNSMRLRDKLKEFLEEHNLSPGQFSVQADLSYTYIPNFISGLIKSPTIDVAEKIERTMEKLGGGNGRSHIQSGPANTDPV